MAAPILLQPPLRPALRPDYKISSPCSGLIPEKQEILSTESRQQILYGIFFLRLLFLGVLWKSGWEILMSSTLAQRDRGACRPSGCHDWCPCVCAP
ncbi:hypothetical protein CgunFtcFv8_012975 [Champsocephalus gunnari]|uniref:Uncharacterized protein n=1 Tax=Champsocephalus gunnari TaxID=52237 RepID=A0AAN8HYC5_CHAGU|nr:hypothetical protein CgunFtcFv8_012975 [Champsocephalus gunnari]